MRKWLVRGVVAIVGLIALAVAGVYLFLPTERIAALAAAQVKSATGRDLTIAGGLRPSFWPALGVSVADVSLSNAAWAEAEQMFSAESASVGVEILPLLSGEVRVSRVALVGPVVRLEVSEDGARNWEFDTGAGADAVGSASSGDSDGGGGGGASDAASGLEGFSLARAVIENGDIRLDDRSTGRVIALSEVTLSGAFPGLDAPMKVEGAAIWNGAPVDLSLFLDTPRQALTGGAVELEAQLGLDGDVISYTGAVTPPAPGALPVADGAFRLSAASPDELLAKLGLPPLPPEAAGLKAIEFGGEAALTADGVNVALTGALTRDSRAVSLRLNATGGADWRAGGPVTLGVEARSDAFFDIAFDGQIAAPGQTLPDVTGAGAISVTDPTALMTWAGLPANPALFGLSDVSLSGDVAMTAEGLSTDLKGALTRDGRALALTARASGAADWLTAMALNADLALTSPDFLTVTFKGPVAVPPGGAPSISGPLKVKAPDIPALAAWAGAPLEGPAANLTSATLSGDLALNGASVTLSGAAIRIDEITANGAIGAEVGGKPMIRANLDAGPLDLRPFLGGGSSDADGSGDNGGAAPAPSNGWSKDPIDLSALNSLNADIALRTPELTLPDLVVKDADLALTLRNGALSVDVTRAGVFGGGVAGAVKLTDGDAPQLALSLDVNALNLRPALAAFAGTDRIEGLGRAKLNLTSTGASMHALMNNLSGGGEIDLADGAIVGVNLAAMARNVTSAFSDGDKAARKTDFSAVTGTFDIVKGRLTNTDFAFLGPLLRVVGAGEVGIGAQTLNFRLTPKAVASLEGQGGAPEASGIMVPVIIGGTWAKPTFTPDTAALINAVAKDPEGAVKQVQETVKQLKDVKPKDLVKGLLGGGDPGAEAGDGGGEGEGGVANRLLRKGLGGLFKSD